MGLRRQLLQAKQTIRQSAFLRGLRRVLFKHSHLSAYLPILKEQLPDKLQRLYGDKAGKQQTEQGTHSSGHKRQFALSGLFFMTRSCFSPILQLLIIWYAAVFTSIIAIYFMTGMALCYGEEAWVDLTTNNFTVGLNIACILVFTGDVWVQLNVGFIFRGMIIVQKQRAVSRYLRSFFIVDILLIVILVISLGSDSFYSNVPRLIIVLKFARMFEIDELYLRWLSTRIAAKTVYSIWKQLVTIFVIAHTFGIFFYSLDYSLTQRPVCQQNNSLCWLYSATAYAPIIDYGWRVRYFYSLYWGVNTIGTISYGDIAANNPTETVFALFCFCFSMVTYGYVVNNIIRIILWARSAQDNFRADLILYTTFMDNLAVQPYHQHLLRDYLETQFFQERNRSLAVEQEMRNRLPNELREQLLKSAYTQFYSGLQTILFNSPSVVKLLMFLEERKYTEGEIILAQGEPLTKMIYLHKGTLTLTCQHNQTMHTITTLTTPDEFIGLYELILNERAAFSVISVSTSTLYFLRKDKLQSELQRSTDLRENLKLVKDEIKFESNFSRIFYKCYYCQASHHWYRCPNIFPNFSNVSLTRHSQPSPIRLALVHWNIWKQRKNLKDLQKFSQKVIEPLLNKLEERVNQLKSIQESSRRQFDTDVHHEWAYYKPQHNLSKFKEEWNKRQRQATAPFIGFQAMLEL